MIYLSKQKSQTFVFGAVILLISNVLVKLIGAVFKIPLTHIIGVAGMSNFNAAYSIYVSFYMISTAGIPVAVSRMIAASNSKGNINEVKKIFRLAYWLFFTVGLVGTVAMIVFSRSFAEFSKMPDSYLAMIVIAPTLFFICLSSAYRGYFQGMQNMVPSAVSQVIESVGKLGIGLVAAWYFRYVKGYELHVVAAYVISGVTIGVFAATVYIYIIKLMYNSSAEYKHSVEACADMPVRSSKSLLYELVITSLPIAIASSIMGLTNTVDTFLMARRLVLTGISSEAAASFYGTYTSMVIPLFNMTPTFIYPFAISVIPALSAAIANNKPKDGVAQMESAFRMGAIISIPCAIGIGVMSKGIVSLLFSSELIDTGSYAIDAIDLAAPALSIVACAIFFLGIISITNSILQAYRFERKTIFSTSAGIIAKIIFTYFLSSIPGIGIMGSAVGTAACYFVIMSFNVFFVIKYTHFVPSIRKTFLKPLISGVVCGLTAILVSNLLDGRINAKIATILSIGVAACVYLVILLLIKGINRKDVLMIPKGEKICAVMDKFNLLEKTDAE